MATSGPDISISDLARETGLSTTTVWRAMNNSGRISPATRNKVLLKARELDYQPNILARGLAGGTTRSVGVLWAFTSPASNAALANEIVNTVQKAGYIAYLGNHRFEIDVACRMLDDFRRRRVDAVVFLAEMQEAWTRNPVLSLLRQFPLPILVTNSAEEIPLPAIYYDRCTAIREVARHFARTGRKRPGYLLPLKLNPPFKVDVFRRELALHGLPAEIIDVPTAGVGMPREYYEALVSRFPEQVTCDSIFCAQDDAAAATVAFLKSRGLRVPQDVAVVGFDNAPGFEYFDPPLATVERREDLVVDAIGRVLDESLTRQEPAVTRQTVSMEFLWRPSAG